MGGLGHRGVNKALCSLGGGDLISEVWELGRIEPMGRAGFRRRETFD